MGAIKMNKRIKVLKYAIFHVFYLKLKPSSLRCHANTKPGGGAPVINLPPITLYSVFLFQIYQFLEYKFGPSIRIQIEIRHFEYQKLNKKQAEVLLLKKFDSVSQTNLVGKSIKVLMIIKVK